MLFEAKRLFRVLKNINLENVEGISLSLFNDKFYLTDARLVEPTEFQQRLDEDAQSRISAKVVSPFGETFGIWVDPNWDRPYIEVQDLNVFDPETGHPMPIFCGWSESASNYEAEASDSPYYGEKYENLSATGCGCRNSREFSRLYL